MTTVTPLGPLFFLGCLFLGVPAFADGPVLKTGQATEQYPGDDGTYQSGIARSYSRAGGIVTDQATGLQWQDDYSDNKGFATNDTIPQLDWATVQAYCGAIDLGGQGDWRAPSVEDLKTLVDYSVANPAIDQTVFQNTMSSYYWSSTPRLDGTNNAWTVSFQVGQAGGASTTNSFYARCVRGDPLPLESTYARDETLETVYDERTDLTWQDNEIVATQELEWAAAIDYCEALEHGGVDDWRLPNFNELYMIADRSTEEPAIDPVFQHVSFSDDYRTSTGSALNPIVVWYVSFRWGSEGLATTTGNTKFVRCVRSGRIGGDEIHQVPLTDQRGKALLIATLLGLGLWSAWQRKSA